MASWKYICLSFLKCIGTVTLRGCKENLEVILIDIINRKRGGTNPQII